MFARKYSESRAASAHPYTSAPQTCQLRVVDPGVINHVATSISAMEPAKDCPVDIPALVRGQFASPFWRASRAWTVVRSRNEHKARV
jgi:hypothetical protein